FGPFPPPTALLLVPLAGLSPLAALRVTTVLSLLSLFCSIGLLARIASLSLLDTAVLVCLSGSAIYNNLRLGQPYMEVSLACILGYHLWLKQRAVWAGICFGLFAPIKYFPAGLLVYFALSRQWQVVLGAAAASAAVVLLSVAALGWQVH